MYAPAVTPHSDHPLPFLGSSVSCFRSFSLLSGVVSVFNHRQNSCERRQVRKTVWRRPLARCGAPVPAAAAAHPPGKSAKKPKPSGPEATPPYVVLRTSLRQNPNVTRITSVSHLAQLNDTNRFIRLQNCSLSNSGRNCFIKFLLMNEISFCAVQCSRCSPTERKKRKIRKIRFYKIRKK